MAALRVVIFKNKAWYEELIMIEPISSGFSSLREEVPHSIVVRVSSSVRTEIDLR